MREGWGPGGQASSARVEAAGAMVSGLEEAAGPRGARGCSQGWGAACDMGASSLVRTIVVVLQPAELALPGGPGSQAVSPPLCQGVRGQKSVLARGSRPESHGTTD